MKRFGLSSKEKIKTNTEFKLLYSRGKVLISGDKKLKAIFFAEERSSLPGVKIAAAVHKKAGKAVWRNRTKRIIREAYRVNKTFLINKAAEKGVSLRIIFSPIGFNEKSNSKLKLKDILPGVWDLMKKIYDSF